MSYVLQYFIYHTSISSKSPCSKSNDRLSKKMFVPYKVGKNNTHEMINFCIKHIKKSFWKKYIRIILLKQVRKKPKYDLNKA